MKQSRTELVITLFAGLFAAVLVCGMLYNIYVGRAWTHEILPYTTSKPGFPSPAGRAITGAERDAFIYALAGGALSRNSTTQTLAAGGQIDCDDFGIVTVAGSGGDVTLTSDPQILTPTDQPTTKFCIIEGVSTNRLTLVDGTGLDLAGRASITLGANAGDSSFAAFVYNGTDWFLIAANTPAAPNLVATDISGATAITAQYCGKYVKFTAAATATMAAASSLGYGCTVCFYARDDSEAYRIDVQAGEKINLDGTAQTAGVDITTSAVGSTICLVADTDTDNGTGTDGYYSWGNNGWATGS